MNNYRSGYRLSDSARERCNALDTAIESKALKENLTIRQAVAKKKASLTHLRLHGKTNDSERITNDMKYLDSKRLLGNTLCNKDTNLTKNK